MAAGSRPTDRLPWRAVPPWRTGVHRWCAARAGLAALCALAVLAAAACSSSGTGTGSSSAEAASDRVVELYRLDDSTRSCLTGQFTDSADARAAATSTGDVSGAQQRALGDALEACIAPEVLASSVAARIGESLPPSDTARAGEQATCLRAAVLQLDEAGRRALAVGLVALGVDPTSDLGLARSDVVNGLYRACGVAATR